MSKAYAEFNTALMIFLAGLVVSFGVIVPIIHALRLLRVARERKIPATAVLVDAVWIIFKESMIVFIFLYMINAAGFPIFDYANQFFSHIDKTKTSSTGSVTLPSPSSF
jgi:hypothetical protein